jgi:hypothetical protein
MVYRNVVLLMPTSFMAQKNLPAFNLEHRRRQSPDLDIEDSDYIDSP